jgi:FMN phosphatase YigB (HAD superfamily)
MTPTVLLDLDDTLLSNDINAFISVYFKLLGEAFEPDITAAQFQGAMQQAVGGMLKKTTPRFTLQEAFDQIFYPAIGIEKSDLIGRIESFYADIFPRLKDLTQPRPRAIEIVHYAIEHSWNVVIATNPLFPRTAILQRLTWAGLPPGEIPFALITDYENAHYAKPKPAYYAEILAQIRWPEGPVAMVGNSLEDDILPAEQLGLATYWLCEDCGAHTNIHNPVSWRGSLEGVIPWLERIATEDRSPTFDEPSALVATLQATPAALDTFSNNLAEGAWNHRPAKNEWGFTEILCHLRDVDLEVNLERLQAVIAGQRPFLPGVITDDWVEERNYAAENGMAALEGFIRARTEVLNLLTALEEDSWGQSARHAIFGPTNLKELVGFIATHDRAHIQQAWEALQPRI